MSNQIRHKIDCRGLTLDQKKQIWAHYWRSDLGQPVSFRNIDDHDTVITVYEPGSAYAGNVARDGGMVFNETDHYAETVKPNFEKVEVVTYEEKFVGLKPEIVERHGRKYKLILVEE